LVSIQSGKYNQEKIKPVKIITNPGKSQQLDLLSYDFSDRYTETPASLYNKYEIINKSGNISFKSNAQNTGNVPEFIKESCCRSGSLVVYKPNEPEIINLFKVDNNIFRSAQPGSSDSKKVNADLMKAHIRFLRDKCGIKTILNLASKDINIEKKAIELEERIVREVNEETIDERKKIQFINFPFHINDVTEEQTTKIYNLITNSQNYPVLIHCREGKDRTGLAVALYRIYKYPKTDFKDIISEMIHCNNDPINGCWIVALILADFTRKLDVLKPYYNNHKKEIDPYIQLFDSLGNVSLAEKRENIDGQKKLIALLRSKKLL